jgi:hypothetical protein
VLLDDGPLKGGRDGVVREGLSVLRREPGDLGLGKPQGIELLRRRLERSPGFLKRVLGLEVLLLGRDFLLPEVFLLVRSVGSPDCGKRLAD